MSYLASFSYLNLFFWYDYLHSFKCYLKQFWCKNLSTNPKNMQAHSNKSYGFFAYLEGLETIMHVDTSFFLE